MRRGCIEDLPKRARGAPWDRFHLPLTRTGANYVDFATLRRRRCSAPLPVSFINLFPGAVDGSNFAQLFA